VVESLLFGARRENMNSKDLVTYCGGYCGVCARFLGFTAFREAASLLAELVDAHGFQHWMPQAVKEFDYTEFRKGLAFFGNPESWLVCRQGCRSGDGRPECEIRKCCQERECDICFDCGEFPCDKVKENTRIIKRANEYKKLGKDEWLRQQLEKANQGFEPHSEKYYQIWAREYPPAQTTHNK
jgi:hypothetical protein